VKKFLKTVGKGKVSPENYTSTLRLSNFFKKSEDEELKNKGQYSFRLSSHLKVGLIEVRNIFKKK
jgi:hypothetical protein